MATFNTSRASKAWDDYNKDLIDSGPSSNPDASKNRYKVTSAALEASQAKILNKELLKQSKAVGKTIESLEKQQETLSKKQAELQTLLENKEKLQKDLDKVNKDTSLDSKEKAKAVKKAEADLEKATKSLSALQDNLGDLQESLDTKFSELDDTLTEFETDIKLTTKQASTDLGKELIKRSIKDTAERNKKELLDAKLNSKDLQEILKLQMQEVIESASQASSKEEKERLTKLYTDLNTSSISLQRGNYKAYVEVNKKMQATDYEVGSALEKRLSGIEDWTKQTQDFRKEKTAARWEKADKVASFFGLSNTLDTLKGVGRAAKFVGGGVSDIAKHSIRGVSSLLGPKEPVASPIPASLKKDTDDVDEISQLIPAESATPQPKWKPTIVPKSISEPSKKIAEKSTQDKSVVKKERPALCSVSNVPKLLSPPTPKDSEAETARYEARAEEDSSLLRRQVKALEKIALIKKSGGDENSSSGFLSKFFSKGGWLSSIGGSLARLGNGLFKGIGGLLTKAFSLVLPILSALTGPVATLAAAAAVGYATYKATTALMDFFKIDPGKLGTMLYDFLHPEESKTEDQKLAETRGASPEAAKAATVKADARRAALTVAKSNGTEAALMESWKKEDLGGPVQLTPTEANYKKTLSATSAKITALPGSTAGGGRGSVNPELPQQSSTPAAPSAPVSGGQPPAAQTSPVSTVKSSVGGGRGSVNPDSVDPNLSGASLSEAKGKLFKTSKSGESLDGVNPAVQSNFTAMVADYKANGGKKTINLNSGFRSKEEQAKLYAANPSKAAPPGRSAHGTGLAIDINSAEANDLDSKGLLSKYGFARPVKGEAWHLQAAGTAASLAKSGAISADSSADQPATRPKSLVSGKGSSESASPITEMVASVPAGVEASADKPASSGQPQGGKQGAVGIGNVTKGSVSSIPTHSYMDGGFFMMNMGLMT